MVIDTQILSPSIRSFHRIETLPWATRTREGATNWPGEFRYYRTLAPSHEHDIARLASALRHEGLRDPLVITADAQLSTGPFLVHGFLRFRALQKLYQQGQWAKGLSMGKVPCIVIKRKAGLSLEDLIRLNIRANCEQPKAWKEKNFFLTELEIIVGQLLSTNFYVDCKGKPMKGKRALRSFMCKISGFNMKQIQEKLKPQYRIVNNNLHYFDSKGKPHLLRRQVDFM